MKNRLFYIVVSLTFLGLTGCADSKISKHNLANEAASSVQQKKKPSDFLPEGYVITENINGDLNKDGFEDCILIIKGTDKKNIIKDEDGKDLDRNRRGIIILFNKKKYFELAVKNYDCFSSENEDGGVYFAPELSVEINKGNLKIHYSHGRYGYWEYTFRFQNLDFELIGYDGSSNHGPVINRITSINFLTKKKQEKINVNENAEGEDEVFEETWKNIGVTHLIKLSEIEDFDSLEMLE